MMKLKEKYLKLMTLGLFLIPIVFLVVNYFMYALVLMSEYVFEIEVRNPFNGTILTLITYSLFFLVLILLVMVGTKYITNIVNRLDKMKRIIETIAFDDELPQKIEVKSGKRDEIDELGLSVNILIDRLLYKELELNKRIRIEQQYMNQMSHDINTPLTALRLELFHLAHEYHIKAEDINVSYERIEYISKLIRNISIDQKDKIQYFYTFNNEVDIQSLCASIISKWQYLFKRQGIEVTYKVLNEQVIWLGEALWYERLFENIISNIYKHSNAKNVCLTLSSSQISFSDDGVGFNPREYQESNGLNIIQNIAERFHLNVEFQSNHHGTTVVLKANQSK
ncbi:sensor histidine kinase [Staphylococcus felis]|nr:sensor histidine kinase [Staphylococcus felis]